MPDVGRKPARAGVRRRLPERCFTSRTPSPRRHRQLRAHVGATLLLVLPSGEGQSVAPRRNAHPYLLPVPVRLDDAKATSVVLQAVDERQARRAGCGDARTDALRAAQDGHREPRRVHAVLSERPRVHPTALHRRRVRGHARRDRPHHRRGAERRSGRGAR